MGLFKCPARDGKLLYPPPSLRAFLPPRGQSSLLVKCGIFLIPPIKTLVFALAYFKRMALLTENPARGRNSALADNRRFCLIVRLPLGTQILAACCGSRAPNTQTYDICTPKTAIFERQTRKQNARVLCPTKSPAAMFAGTPEHSHKELKRLKPRYSDEERGRAARTDRSVPSCT